MSETDGFVPWPFGGPRPQVLPHVPTADELLAGFADPTQAAVSAQAQQLAAAERDAAQPIEHWQRETERAQQNRAAVDGFIAEITTPLVAVFTQEFSRRDKRSPRRPGALADIPLPGQDPKAWREYLQKHCYEVPWTPATDSSDEYFATGLPGPDGAMELIGFGGRMNGGNVHLGFYVRNGRIVAAYRHGKYEEEGMRVFTTGIPGEQSEPPQIISISGHGKKARHVIGTYSAEDDDWQGNPAYADHTRALGEFAEMLDALQPRGGKAYLNLAIAFDLSRERVRLPGQSAWPKMPGI